MIFSSFFKILGITAQNELKKGEIGEFSHKKGKNRGKIKHLFLHVEKKEHYF